MAVNRITIDSTELPLETTTVEVDDIEVPPETTTVGVNDIEVPPETTIVGVNDIEVPPETTTVEVDDIEVPPETTTVEGLQNILERRFPYAEHRYYARHLYVNYGDKFNRGKALRSMFWDACKATNKVAFDDAMATFREKDKPKSGPREKKRRREAGELATKKDKKGKAYKTVRRTGEQQKCSVCKKIGHNKRAHGSSGVVPDCNRASSSTTAVNNSVQGTPPERGPIPTPSVRVTRSKMRVTRGGHTR
ncbi:hypothetical protein LINPERHAP1_LOCUS11325 [Linum perenne]